MKTRLKLSDGDQISRRAFWLLFDQCKDFVDMATVGKKRTRVSRASLLTVRQSELIHRTRRVWDSDFWRRASARSVRHNENLIDWLIDWLIIYGISNYNTNCWKIRWLFGLEDGSLKWKTPCGLLQLNPRLLVQKPTLFTNGKISQKEIFRTI